MLMPSGRQTKRIIEKSSLLAGICKVFWADLWSIEPHGTVYAGNYYLRFWLI